MNRSLRGLLLGGIAIALLYLLVHAREPLRLNVGDPWSDASVLLSIDRVKSDGLLATSFSNVLEIGPLAAEPVRYIHYPPLSEIFYGALGKYLGISDIATLRLFALAWSVLAMWLLYCYVRRLYSDRVALIATALFSTSVLWLMYADSIHQAPVMQCTGFLALWGLARAIDTRQRRHRAALVLGSFACFFSSYDYALLLPTAALATIYLKAGNPFARGNRHLVALCALGCVLGIAAKCLCAIGAVGWNEFIADLRLTFVERATSKHDRMVSALPIVLRRMMLVFTPLVWITFVLHVWKALRAPSWAAAIKGTALWLLLPGVAFFYAFSQVGTSQMLASQVLAPFYAIGTALILDRWLDGRPLYRQMAFAWLAAAALWSAYIVFMHPRSVLDRGDVARTNAYLAASDRNDFVLSNLLSDGPIQVSFQRHNWPALDALDARDARHQMLRIFELTGADHVHAIIFAHPRSRFIDRALWPLAIPRRLWAIAGWPHVFRTKANAVITDYDRRVVKSLATVNATKVLELGDYAIHRIDRDRVMALLTGAVPAGSRIDFASVNSLRHELSGWTGPHAFEDGTLASTIWDLERCPHKRCRTVPTSLGLTIPEIETRRIGQLMLRVEPVCDRGVSVTFVKPSYARFAINGFVAGPFLGNPISFTVPAAHLTEGINVLEIENIVPGTFGLPLPIVSLDLAPCAAR